MSVRTLILLKAESTYIINKLYEYRSQTPYIIFNKGLDQYFFIPYLAFLFLYFPFFLPYILIRMSRFLDIDFFFIPSKAFEEIFFLYVLLSTE